MYSKIEESEDYNTISASRFEFLVINETNLIDNMKIKCFQTFSMV